MITPTSSSATQNTRQAADSMAYSADKAIDATRGYTNELLDSAAEKVSNLHRKVEPALEKFANKAQDIAQRGMDMASYTTEQAKEKLSNYSAVTTRYVAEKPMQSILIAAAVGAALALLISSNSRRNYR